MGLLQQVLSIVMDEFYEMLILIAFHIHAIRERILNTVDMSIRGFLLPLHTTVFSHMQQASVPMFYAYTVCSCCTSGASSDTTRSLDFLQFRGTCHTGLFSTVGISTG